MNRRLLGAYAAVPLALMFALAGCGKSDDGHKVASVSGTSSASANASGAADGLTDQERGLKYAQCMRDNGVEAFPDPQPGGGMMLDRKIAEDPDFEAANKKRAAQYMPGASTGGPTKK